MSRVVFCQVIGSVRLWLPGELLEHVQSRVQCPNGLPLGPRRETDAKKAFRPADGSHNLWVTRALGPRRIT